MTSREDEEITEEEFHECCESLDEIADLEACMIPEAPKIQYIVVRTVTTRWLCSCCDCGDGKWEQEVSAGSLVSRAPLPPQAPVSTARKAKWPSTRRRAHGHRGGGANTLCMPASGEQPEGASTGSQKERPQALHLRFRDGVWEQMPSKGNDAVAVKEENGDEHRFTAILRQTCEEGLAE